MSLRHAGRHPAANLGRRGGGDGPEGETIGPQAQAVASQPLQFPFSLSASTAGPVECSWATNDPYRITQELVDVAHQLAQLLIADG